MKEDKKWRTNGYAFCRDRGPLAKPNHAIIGLNRAAGAPQLTVVWYRWDGTSFFFRTTKESAKHYNLKREPVKEGG
jgi:hypothetical protein